MPFADIPWSQKTPEMKRAYHNEYAKRNRPRISERMRNYLNVGNHREVLYAIKDRYRKRMREEYPELLREQHRRGWERIRGDPERYAACLAKQRERYAFKKELERTK